MIKEKAAHNGDVPPLTERKAFDDQGRASLVDNDNMR